MDFPVPENEAERLRAIAEYNILGTPPEMAFDDLTELAAQIAGTAFSMMTIITDSTVWLKANHGVPPDAVEMPRGVACCATTLCQSDLLVVPNLEEDPRFKDSPLIATEPFLKFYAGMPLINPEGYALGTFCLYDFAPRDLPYEIGEAIRRLARQAVAQLELRRRLTELQDTQKRLVEEKRRADDLILNILPTGIATELEREGRVAPRHYPSATILFADFVDFTRVAEQLAPRSLVDGLDEYFSAFDDIIDRCGLEKLKTIGDAFMAAGGLPEENKHHAADACLAALQMQEFMARANAQRERMRLAPWPLRIGIHTGSVMAGVVGKRKFAYDVWGDAVNVAARLETASEPGRINIAEATLYHVKQFFEADPRGDIEVKNKGGMYFLDRLKPEFSQDPAGMMPNDAFRTAAAGSGTTWALPT